MIPLVGSAVCYGFFLLFEAFAISLDRLSPIKIRGLLEEHPEHFRLLSGPGEVEIIRTTTKVLVQILLLFGLLSTVSVFGGFGVPHPWAWGGATFVAGSAPMKSCRLARSNPAPATVTCTGGDPLAGACAGEIESTRKSGS